MKWYWALASGVIIGVCGAAFMCALAILRVIGKLDDEDLSFELSDVRSTLYTVQESHARLERGLEAIQCEPKDSIRFATNLLAGREHSEDEELEVVAELQWADDGGAVHGC